MSGIVPVPVLPILPKKPEPWEQVYYDESTKNYLFPRGSENGWFPLNEGSLKRQLIALGVSKDRLTGQVLSQLDEALNRIQKEKGVIYAGPLAGYLAGQYEQEGARFLVTESPKFIEPKPGEWPTISKVLSAMLGEEQKLHLFGWLKISIQALRQQKYRPGQALVIAGGVATGKSLLQNLITQMLGGRSAKPYQFMTGQTTFNGDLFCAEHLMIEDESSSQDMRTRKRFGAEIKQLTVNETNRFHPKGKQAINLRPFWRLSISLNETPEDLMVLPPLVEGLEDKLILLRASPQEFPTESPEEKAKFYEALLAELPALIHWLLQWEIPMELRSARFGVTHYHHPKLVDSVNALAPEMKLWNVIECELLTDRPAWKGSALELEKALLETASEKTVRQILSWPQACGTYLGRLHKMMPEKVAKERTPDARLWELRSNE